MPDSEVRKLYPEWASEEDILYSFWPVQYLNPFSKTYDFETNTQIIDEPVFVANPGFEESTKVCGPHLIDDKYYDFSQLS